MEAILETQVVETARAKRDQLGSAELAHRMIDIALDKKASDVVLLDIRPVSYLADYFVILSADSERQIKAISEALIHTLRDDGLKPTHAEGRSASGWVLLDYGDVVVHVFSREARNFYRLEKVWEEAGLVLRVQ